MHASDLEQILAPIQSLRPGAAAQLAQLWAPEFNGMPGRLVGELIKSRILSEEYAHFRQPPEPAPAEPEKPAPVDTDPFRTAALERPDNVLPFSGPKAAGFTIFDVRGDSENPCYRPPSSEPAVQPLTSEQLVERTAAYHKATAQRSPGDNFIRPTINRGGNAR